MDIVLWSGVFIVSLFVLIKAADLFIGSAEQISLSFNIPSFIIGATLVSVGTSLPELISSGLAVLANQPEIPVGNVVGSNITNILLIIGVTILASGKIYIHFNNLKYDFILSLLSALLLTFFLWDLDFSFIECIICIACVVLYVIYIIKFHKLAGNIGENHQSEKVKWTTYLRLVASAVLIFIGAKFTVQSIESLSEILNLSSGIIALTALALGTSLPELVVSITAARKGLTDIVIGNILGSNIFNTFAVMGFPALLGKMAIPEIMIQFSLPVMVMATFIFFLIAIKRSGGFITGLLFVVFYLIFILGTFYKINFIDLFSNII